jgi:hypothetical protein
MNQPTRANAAAPQVSTHTLQAKALARLRAAASIAIALLSGCHSSQVSPHEEPSADLEVHADSLPPWLRDAVHQKNRNTGCIPWGYELLLRAARTPGIDFETFQDDFDLKEHNNFASVAKAVQSRYPWVDIDYVDFRRGAEKLTFVEQRLSAGKPTLASIALQGLNPSNRGWHIMPIIAATNEDLLLLMGIDDGRPNILRLSKTRFVQIHDQFPGGSDVAFLKP